MTGNSRYFNSTSMLARAERVIPLGSQTFSKSRVQYPVGHAPLFLERGKGGRVWDVDGNEYVDLICGLLPVVLGYCDPDVDQAITAQMSKGIVFSLASELESILAEKLVGIIPCAEMARFGKNGSDATSGAVRLARAVTGRDRIAAGGYHGWHDWYIGATTRNRGVPRAVAELTHRFPYGDISALHKLFREHPGQFAAAIMEPMNTVEPPAGYLFEVRELCHKNGVLFILDEIITGFRFSLGGAQELFGVTPDLACFGKSMANGMPISALVGKEEYMRHLEDLFFSFTFGGEALSLAAAIAVIDKMQREPVIEGLWSKGQFLAEAVEQKIAERDLATIVSLVGKPPWKILQFSSCKAGDQHEVKTFLMRGLFDRGVLSSASHNICYAHSNEDFKHVIHAYASALDDLVESIQDDTLRDRLHGVVVRPVFSVR